MNIKELYKRFENGESASKLSLEVGVHRETLIKKFVSECGYVRKKANKNKSEITSDILKKAYKMYVEENKYLANIANIFNINRKKLSKELVSAYNIKIRKDGKKDVNSFAFSKITRDSAYWLGIMLTDGYVSNNNKFELSLKDKEHIEKFKVFLKSRHLVQERITIINESTCINYRLSICDNQIVNDLNKLNCVNNKSFIVELPILEDEYMPDLIRGIFDGDGCVSRTSTKRNMITICSASNKFLKDIETYLETKGIKCTRISKNRELYNLNISVKKDNLLKFYNLIYENSKKENRLDRKYEKMKAICRLKTKPQKS